MTAVTAETNSTQLWHAASVQLKPEQLNNLLDCSEHTVAQKMEQTFHFHHAWLVTSCYCNTGEVEGPLPWPPQHDASTKFVFKASTWDSAPMPESDNLCTELQCQIDTNHPLSMTQSTVDESIVLEPVSMDSWFKKNLLIYFLESACYFRSAQHKPVLEAI